MTVYGFSVNSRSKTLDAVTEIINLLCYLENKTIIAIFCYYKQLSLITPIYYFIVWKDRMSVWIALVWQPQIINNHQNGTCSFSSLPRRQYLSFQSSSTFYLSITQKGKLKWKESDRIFKSASGVFVASKFALCIVHIL